VPEATTEKVAGFPEVTVALPGWEVMTGGAGFTVRVAALLVTEPALLLTVTVKLEPVSAMVVAGVV
jgi:hypothetical protein